MGDFVVALPCLHLIRRSFPSARITLITSRDPDARAASAESVLSDCGLVDAFVTYTLNTRNFGELTKLLKTIRALHPDLLIYLATPRSSLATIYRDYVFFRLCGVKRMVGFPFAAELRQLVTPVSGDGLWEREAQRLGRWLAPLGSVEPERIENWDLRLTPDERAKAQDILKQISSIQGRSSRLLVGLSVGTKQAIKDWGDNNWRWLVEGLSDANLGLVLIGSEEDRSRSERLSSGWAGPVLNLCGFLTPRESAAVIERLHLFLCHDSGPMHLSVAVGTRVVAVFTNHRPPGQWFPYGGNHIVFYPPSGAKSIHAIDPSQVLTAALDALSESA